MNDPSPSEPVRRSQLLPGIIWSVVLIGGVAGILALFINHGDESEAPAVRAPTVAATATPAAIRSFTVRVSGSRPDGSEAWFRGSIMTVQRDGSSRSRSVEDRAPIEYTEPGASLSVSFQKQFTRGSLRVEVMRDGRLIDSQTTTAEYGLVSVSTR